MHSLLLLIFAAGSIYATTPPVIGGTEVDKLYAPAVVKLLVTNHEGEGLCTGAYVGTNAILTAAHCVKDFGFVSKKDVGETIFNKLLSRITNTTIENKTGIVFSIVQKTAIKINGNDIGISKIILDRGHDLAILVTGSKVDNYAFISLEKPMIGQAIALIGYGRDCYHYDCVFSPGGVVKRLGFNKIHGVYTNKEDSEIEEYEYKAGVKVKINGKDFIPKTALYVSGVEKKRVAAIGLDWGLIKIVGQLGYEYFNIIRNTASVGSGDSGGPLVNQNFGIIGVAISGTNCTGKMSYKIDPEEKRQIELGLLYGDMNLSILSLSSYSCLEQYSYYGDEYSLSFYSMIEKSIPFIKFAIKNGADINIINKNESDYAAASSGDEYYKIYDK